jgi:hypothetical protein
MAQIEDLDALTYVTLVDRTGGPSEFLFDGKRFGFTRDKAQRNVPRFVAEWLFRSDRAKVWTVDHGFAYRYGIKDGPEDLLETLGEEPFETSPIEIDATRVEGWNVEAVDDNPSARRTLQLKRNPADYAHQGGTVAGTFSKER